MAKGIQIAFTATNDEVIAASGQVQDSLTGVADKLGDVGEASQAATDWFTQGMAASREVIRDTLHETQKLEDAERARREALADASMEAAMEKYRDSVKDADRAVEDLGATTDDSDRSLERMGETGDDATRKVGQGFEEVERSADQANTAVGEEGGSAFDELLGKADTSLGGVGDKLLGVAGIAGGIGGVVAEATGFAIDQVTAMIEAQTSAAQELRDNLVKAYQDASAEGFAYLDNAAVIAAANDILFDTSKREAAAEKAAEIGVTLSTYVLAQAGSIEALNTTLEAAEQAYEDVGVAAGTGSKSAQAAAVEQGLGIQGVIGELDALKAAHEQGQEAAQTEAAIRQELTDSEIAQLDRTTSANQARWDAYAAAAQAAIASVPTEQTVVIKADTSQAEAAIASFQRQQRYANVEVQLTKNGVPVY